VDSQDNLLTVHIVQYQAELMIDDVGMQCEVHVNNVKIDFVLQPVLRLIDLILYQIMLSFGEDRDPYKIAPNDA